MKSFKEAFDSGFEIAKKLASYPYDNNENLNDANRDAQFRKLMNKNGLHYYGCKQPADHDSEDCHQWWMVDESAVTPEMVEAKTNDEYNNPDEGDRFTAWVELWHEQQYAQWKQLQDTSAEATVGDSSNE